MKNKTFTTQDDAAQFVTEQSVQILREAITKYGHATWVLAGGSTPNIAYQYIAANYMDSIDWEKVAFIIGDERIGPLDDANNNWSNIEQIFLRFITNARFLRPKSYLTAEEAAVDYTQQLITLPKNHNDTPRFDLTWLGMGEDGHTLSLFPNHSDFNPEDTALVSPVHNSPKPPSDRISLTLYALQGSTKTFIIATGNAKQSSAIEAQKESSSLPIALASRKTNAIWITDFDLS